MQRFRLGTTSFIYRAGWRENVARLAGRVDDVELLFFDAARPEDLPGSEELAALRALCDVHALSYSAHTPLDASLASENESVRRDSVAATLRVIEATRSLDVHAYVLHVYLGDCEHDPRRPSDLDAWRERAARSIEELLARGASADKLCIESLDYDLELLAPVLDRFALPVALDVGHMHRDGHMLASAVDRWLPRTKLLQWHGTDPSDRDHRSLAHYPEAEARWLLRTLCERDFGGVLTLEVFREDDFETSLALVRRWLSEVQA
jgi:sugar phosphate isomerase/epimerase